MTSLQIKSALLFSLMLSAAALSYAAHAAPAAAPAASAEPASGTMVMTARETPEAACARGEAAACTVAALRVLPSVDKARSEQKAVGEARALFEKGCRGGDPESCRHLGLLLAEGRIYSADLPAAKELLSRGCTIGDDRSCREMARIANDAGEHEALVSWLGKSCMLGNETSCMRTATLDRSDDRVRWVEEACRLGRMDACLDAAERRQNGNGVPVDMKLALQNYQAACRLNNAPSCFRAAKILRSGDGVKADPKAAAVWYDKACRCARPAPAPSSATSTSRARASTRTMSAPGSTTTLPARAAFARAAPRPAAEPASRARIELPVGQNPLKDLVPLAFTANTLPLIPSGSAPGDHLRPSPQTTYSLPPPRPDRSHSRLPLFPTGSPVNFRPHRPKVCNRSFPNYPIDPCKGLCD